MQYPVVLGLQELQEQRVVLGVQTREAQEARIAHGRLDRLGRARRQDLSQDPILGLEAGFTRPELLERLLLLHGIHRPTSPGSDTRDAEPVGFRELRLRIDPAPAVREWPRGGCSGWRAACLGAGPAG